MNKKKLLIVEDSADLRELLSFALENYELKLCGSLMQAIESVNYDPHLILTDLTLNDNSTADSVIEKLKITFPKSKILILSGNGHLPALARLNSLPYMAKPYDLDEINRLVTQILID